MDKLKTVPFLFLLQRYYNGDFCSISLDEWKEIANVLSKETLGSEQSIKEGLKLLNSANADDCEKMKFDFNKLFIGPAKLLAPPYASCYLNPDKVLMQQVTLRVREMYSKAGLEVASKNVEPDDFLAYELDFLIYLLEKEDDKYMEIFDEFLNKHLLTWYDKHIEEIRNNSTNSINIGITYILQGVMDSLRI